MASPDGLLQVPQIYTVIMQVEHKIIFLLFFFFIWLPTRVKTFWIFKVIKVTIKLSVAIYSYLKLFICWILKDFKLGRLRYDPWCYPIGGILFVNFIGTPSLPWLNNSLIQFHFQFLSSLGVHRLSSVNFSCFNLLLQNYSTNWTNLVRDGFWKEEIQISTNEVDLHRPLGGAFV